MPTDSYTSKRALLLCLLISFCFANSLRANVAPFTPPGDSTTVIDSSLLRAWNVTNVLRNDMVSYAKEFLGIHYQYAGRAPETGFDCSGFTHFVMRNFDVKICTSSRGQSAEGKQVNLKHVKAGDLIFFRRSSRSRISHVAMVVDNNDQGVFIIHSTSRGVVIDNLMTSKYWRPKVYSARDVVHKFTDAYARERLQLLLAHQSELQQMQINLAAFSKGLRI
jgi:hypothetical protein